MNATATSRWTRLAATAGAAALAAHLALVFFLTPDDDLMGFVQKIMYLHVPSIGVTYLSFFVTFACSIAYLWKRDAAFDRVARASAELGVLFCGVALASGAIWGRPTWGTYWVWDARLTTTLLLFLIFAGYLLLRAYSPPGERQARTAAVIAIVGFLDIPLIHVSVEWWRTLHQRTTMFKLGEDGALKPAMPPELLWPLLTGLVALTIVYGALMLVRVRLAMREERLALSLAGE